MNIPYTQKTFSVPSTITYGSVTERVALSQLIFDYMVNVMGIPLTQHNVIENSDSVGNTWMACHINGNPAFEIATKGTTTYGATLNIACFTVDEFATVFESGHTFYNSFANTLEVSIRWIKSGNSWFFGFAPYNYSSDKSWINGAIVPVRKVSDPNAIVCYAYICQDITDIKKGLLAGTAAKDTSKGIVAREPLADILPEFTEKNVALLPVHMNALDYYFEGVYIANVMGNRNVETTIITDKGTFLIANKYDDTPSSRKGCLVFDITEAMNTSD